MNVNILFDKKKIILFYYVVHVVSGYEMRLTHVVLALYVSSFSIYDDCACMYIDKISIKILTKLGHML
jgi:hypothetical protein